MRPQRSTSKVTHTDGWTQITRGASASDHVPNPVTGVAKEDAQPAVKTSSMNVTVDHNKYIDLLVDASESFFRDDESESSQPAKGDTSFLDVLSMHMKASSTPEAGELQWMYLDPHAARQGPFNSAQMSHWLSAGYFPNDLPVAWFPMGGTLPSSTKFRPLGQVYPNPSGQPFIDAPFSSPSARKTSPKNKALSPAPEVVNQPVGGPPLSKGWLWSPEDAKKITSNTASSDVMSLSAIMELEASRKKKGKPKTPK